MFTNAYEPEWRNTDCLQEALNPLLLSSEHYQIALPILYSHPLLSYTTISSFARSLVHPPRYITSQTKISLVQNLTVRPSPVLHGYEAGRRSNRPNLSMGAIHRQFPEILSLFSILESFTLCDALILCQCDAEVLFEALQYIAPRKVRLEFRMWDLHDSTLGQELLSFTRPDIAPNHPESTLERDTQFSRDYNPIRESWRDALLSRTEFELPTWWMQTNNITPAHPPAPQSVMQNMANLHVLPPLPPPLYPARLSSAGTSSGESSQRLHSGQQWHHPPARAGLGAYVNYADENEARNASGNTLSDGISERPTKSSTSSSRLPSRRESNFHRSHVQGSRTFPASPLSQASTGARNSRPLDAPNAPASDDDDSSLDDAEADDDADDSSSNSSQEDIFEDDTYSKRGDISSRGEDISSLNLEPLDVLTNDQKERLDHLPSPDRETFRLNSSHDDLEAPALGQRGRLYRNSPATSTESLVTFQRNATSTIPPPRMHHRHQPRLHESSRTHLRSSLLSVPVSTGTPITNQVQVGNPNRPHGTHVPRDGSGEEGVSSHVLAHRIRFQLHSLLRSWCPTLGALSLVAYDPLAMLIFRAPHLDFFTTMPVPHIRVSLPPACSSLAVFKGVKEVVREKRRREEGGDEVGSALTKEDKIVGGDGDGGGLLHPEIRLFEIEVNAKEEMMDEIWMRHGNQLPPQACRILAGSNDWRTVQVGGDMRSIVSFDICPRSPSISTSQFDSPTFTFESTDDDISDVGDEMGGGEEKSSTYDAAAALAQKERLSQRLKSVDR
ncbi:hypothetical protein M231_07701 [Tremella mesenterica]|uniref:Uncharacterized protein n=1 Tax=Tremella mesenterica TaxID=5217 RepID=A0A4Q1B8I0_TREME|nr:hypothetical protein M231_07701 [Tremella mesenterica]